MLGKKFSLKLLLSMGSSTFSLASGFQQLSCLLTYEWLAYINRLLRSIWRVSRFQQTASRFTRNLDNRTVKLDSVSWFLIVISTIFLHFYQESSDLPVRAWCIHLKCKQALFYRQQTCALSHSSRYTVQLKRIDPNVQQNGSKLSVHCRCYFCWLV